MFLHPEVKDLEVADSTQARCSMSISSVDTTAQRGDNGMEA